jgi:hypothetical protein
MGKRWAGPTIAPKLTARQRIKQECADAQNAAHNEREAYLMQRRASLLAAFPHMATEHKRSRAHNPSSITQYASSLGISYQVQHQFSLEGFIDKIFEAEDARCAGEQRDQFLWSLPPCTFDNYMDLVSKPFKKAVVDEKVTPKMQEYWHACYCWGQREAPKVKRCGRSLLTRAATVLAVQSPPRSPRSRSACFATCIPTCSRCSATRSRSTPPSVRCSPPYASSRWKIARRVRRSYTKYDTVCLCLPWRVGSREARLS